MKLKNVFKKIYLLLIFFLVTGFHSSGQTYVESTFLYPQEYNKKGDLSIENKLIEKILAAARYAKKTKEKDVNLYLSFFRYEARKGLLNALLNAQESGVNLNIIFGDKNKNMIQVVRKKLANKKRVRFITCNQGCLGTNINHNKFLLINKGVSLKGEFQNHIVAVTSYNFDNRQPHNFNDMSIVYNNSELYHNFVAYWELLWLAKKKDRKIKVTEEQMSIISSQYQVHYSPRKKSDPVIKLLKNIDCSDQTGVIHIAHSRWDRGRRDILKKLRKMQKRGCSVHIIANSTDNLLEDDETLINVHLKESVHNKFILIDAVVNGERQKVSLIGSHNLTANSLYYNDDTLLVLKDRQLYESYLNYWEYLLKAPIIDKSKLKPSR
jgi:phosphatidylserine/phosphatidylglycerophosphate/cardiolipin synthase-like enzyme